MANAFGRTRPGPSLLEVLFSKVNRGKCRAQFIV